MFVGRCQTQAFQMLPKCETASNDDQLGMAEIGLPNWSHLVKIFCEHSRIHFNHHGRSGLGLYTANDTEVKFAVLIGGSITG